MPNDETVITAPKLKSVLKVLSKIYRSFKNYGGFLLWDGMDEDITDLAACYGHTHLNSSWYLTICLYGQFASFHEPTKCSSHPAVLYVVTRLPPRIGEARAFIFIYQFAIQGV